MDAEPEADLYWSNSSREILLCMRRRASQTWTWGFALAVFGVLLHTGLLVRHAVHATQVSASGISVVICQGNGQPPIDARLPPPDDPRKAQHAPCPDCTAAADGPVVLPPHACTPLFVPYAEAFNAPLPSVVPAFRAELPPPGRGPPARIS
jgi:hypothetical protein